MRGNMYVVVPLADMNNQVPAELGKRYKKEDGSSPTWSELTQMVQSLYGVARKVEWLDGKDYVVIELMASFMTGEVDEVYNLRAAKGIQKANKTSAPFGRLIAEEVRDFLAQVDESKVSVYAHRAQ